MSRSVIAASVCVCAAAYLLVGCVGDLIEVIPPSTALDLSAAAVDMAQALELGPPADEMAPAGVRFFPDIQADIDATVGGCSLAGSCHGGSAPMPLKPMPMTPADKMANYMHFMGDVNLGIPAMSLVLQNGIGMNGHVGGSPLVSTSSPVYQRWLAWIAAGAPQ